MQDCSFRMLVPALAGHIRHIMLTKLLETNAVLSLINSNAAVAVWMPGVHACLQGVVDGMAGSQAGGFVRWNMAVCECRCAQSQSIKECQTGACYAGCA